MKKTGIVVTAHRQSLFWIVREIWAYRHLIPLLGKRLLLRRVKETVLGYSWFIIRPAIATAVSTIAFSKIAGISSGEVPYILFFFTGLTIWSFFAQLMNYITRSVRMSYGIIERFSFPRIVIPFSGVAPPLVELTINLAILIILIIFYKLNGQYSQFVFSFRLLCAIPFLILTLILSLGVSFFTSISNMYARDVRFILPYFMNMWYFLTPVIYPLSKIPQKWRVIAKLNPMTTIIEGFKWSILGEGDVDFMSIVVTCVLAIGIFVVGMLFFNKKCDNLPMASYEEYSDV